MKSTVPGMKWKLKLEYGKLEHYNVLYARMTRNDGLHFDAVIDRGLINAVRRKRWFIREEIKGYMHSIEEVPLEDVFADMLVSFSGRKTSEL